MIQCLPYGKAPPSSIRFVSDLESLWCTTK